MRPPLWLQWVASIVVAAAVIFGLVRFVQSNTDNQITTESPAGEVQADREAEILVGQDQAPTRYACPAGFLLWLRSIEQFART